MCYVLCITKQNLKLILLFVFSCYESLQLVADSYPYSLQKRKEKKIQRKTITKVHIFRINVRDGAILKIFPFKKILLRIKVLFVFNNGFPYNSQNFYWKTEFSTYILETLEFSLFFVPLIADEYKITNKFSI